jgi:hypothetical protein
VGLPRHEGYAVLNNAPASVAYSWHSQLCGVAHSQEKEPGPARLLRAPFIATRFEEHRKARGRLHDTNDANASRVPLERSVEGAPGTRPPSRPFEAQCVAGTTRLSGLLDLRNQWRL